MLVSINLPPQTQYSMSLWTCHSHAGTQNGLHLLAIWLQNTEMWWLWFMSLLLCYARISHFHWLHNAEQKYPCLNKSRLLIDKITSLLDCVMKHSDLKSWYAQDHAEILILRLQCTANVKYAHPETMIASIMHIWPLFKVILGL